MKSARHLPILIEQECPNAYEVCCSCGQLQSIANYGEGQAAEIFALHLLRVGVVSSLAPLDAHGLKIG